jgi:hypothetical protein
MPLASVIWPFELRQTSAPKVSPAWVRAGLPPVTVPVAISPVSLLLQTPGGALESMGLPTVTVVPLELQVRVPRGQLARLSRGTTEKSPHRAARNHTRRVATRSERLRRHPRPDMPTSSGQPPATHLEEVVSHVDASRAAPRPRPAREDARTCGCSALDCRLEGEEPPVPPRWFH